MQRYRQLLIHGGLFVLTILTTTLAGAEWSRNKYLVLGMSWEDFLYGFEFSIPFLLILTVHEFAHYFTARYHKINVTLPYYIPMWLGFIGAPSIGTMGAFIKIKEHITSRKKYFDVGVSGPVAGFVVALFVLWYGFANLPAADYIYEIHPEYAEYGTVEEAIAAGEGMTIRLGDTLLFDFFKSYVADPDRLPHPNELMHYPWLLAGFLALFFTALNLLPIGQLDGGHVLFGMLGAQRFNTVSKIIFAGFVFYAGLGWITITDLSDTSLESLGWFVAQIAAYLYILYLCAYSLFDTRINRLMFAAIIFTIQFFLSSFFQLEGYSGWLFFSLLLGRFMGVSHPTVSDHTPLSNGRLLLGCIAIIIFILSFSPQPLQLEGI